MQFVGKCFKSKKDYKGNKEEFIYLFMPKNASMAFRACGLFPGNEDRKNSSKNLFTYNKKWDKLSKICIFRDPISRFISMFTYEVKSGHFKTKDKKINIDNFNNFLKINETKNKWSYTGAPQINYLKEVKCKLEDIDIIMSVETLDRDFNKFKEKYNLNINLPIRNVSKKTNIKKNIFSNNDILNRIKILYEEDIILYNKVREIIG